jgi:galactokinase
VLSDERIDRIGHAFRNITGRRAQGLWCAPGRVNLIGEHTDYNAGLVLPFAIERETLAAVALRDDDELHCWSRQDDGTAWHAYVRGVRTALRATGLVVPGADVVIESDVPVGSGLSSSAALTASVALALHDLVAGEVDRLALARVCQRAENDEVGAPTGLMDPVAALFGEPGSLVLLDTRSDVVAPVPLDLSGLELLVVDTGVRHSTAAAGYAERRRQCQAALELFGVASLRDLDLLRIADAARGEADQLLVRRARHVYTENIRVQSAVALARAGRTRDIGPLMTASHASLRDDFDVSSPELDVTVDAALEAGALGARLTGAGFGGCVIVLCAAEAAELVRTAVTSAYGRLDWPAPTIFAVAPSGGARRLR